MNFISRLATTLVILPTAAGGAANAEIFDHGCETYTEADEHIGQVEMCVKQDSKKAGHFFIEYKDASFQGQMAAYCAEDATGYRSYKGADKTQVMHITRGFCNGMRTESGVARTMATFLF